MRYRFISLTFLILSFSLVSIAQETEIQKCAVPKNIDGKYKLAAEVRPLGEPKRLHVYVVVKPKNFTKEFMTELAKRLKSVYCNEDAIYVTIFDSKEKITGWFHDYVLSGRKVDKRRGTYLIDRNESKETIEFSTKSGNPIDEVRIDFTVS